MQFYWNNKKQVLRGDKTISALTHLLFATIFNLIFATPILFYSTTLANSNTEAKILADTKELNKTIIIINGPSIDNYLLNYLKKQGFFLTNLVTPTSKTSNKDLIKMKKYYDNVIDVKNNVPQILETLTLLFQDKKYLFSGVLTTEQRDIELADIIHEAFKKPFNGKSFRNLTHNKATAINQLNKTLRAKNEVKTVTIEEFSKAASKYPLPCSVKVMSLQYPVVTYSINKSSDIEPILEKLKIYKAPETRILLQPYYENLYRLQISSFRNKTIPVALWHEKSSIRDTEVLEDMRSLENIKEFSLMSEQELKQLSERLTKAIHLSNGISEFVLAFDKKQISVIDYNLALQNINQMEFMDDVLGYSLLSQYLMQSGLISKISIQQGFNKSIIAVNLSLNEKNHLQKLTALPTFYKYFDAKVNAKNGLINGELYLVHSNKELVTTSYAAIRNMEYMLLDLQFASHSTTNIANFYRKAVINKKTDNTINKEDKEIQSFEEKEKLKNLLHNNQHIPKYIKPLNSKATVQDIMRYYIDVYDLYLLHGAPLGTKATALNTGNPAFLPFPQIVTALNKSLQENLTSYARYNFQIPEEAFVNKISRFCQEEKFLKPEQKLQNYNVVIGHGSTNLYYLGLKSIIKNKGDIVLITRPTYGLFIDPIYTAEGEVGFIDIKENASWKVDPQNLRETINFYNQRAFNNYILTSFIKDYNKLLHTQKVFNLKEGSILPIPSINGQNNLKIFDDYIKQLNNYIDNIADPIINKDELKFSFPPRVRAFYHINPHNPTGTVYTKEDLKAIAGVIQNYPEIYVIDDLAHWGVVFGEIEPATFSSLDNMFEKTLTLMSLSKAFCVPGLRAGVAIGNKEIISEMQYRMLNSSSSATLPAIIALNAVFDTPKKERDSYLKNNSQEYLYRKNLMGTLINGIQKTDMTFEQKIKIYQLILESEYKEGKPIDEYKEGKPIDRNFLRLVLSGMPLVRSLTEPKGCFFHLLDISKLIGAKIGGTTLVTATDVRNAIFSICNIDMVPGEISGNFFNYSLRMSFSLTPQQIYYACKNIHLFIINYIIKSNPAILEKSYEQDNTPFKLVELDVIEEKILNKALIRLYLSKAVQSAKEESAKLSSNPQNKVKLNELKQRTATLNLLMEKLLDQSAEKNIHKQINNFIKENETLLKHYLPDLEQLKSINQAA
ncbi:MAG: aminotransferase class I/II-fold pyridoxal phosphate-dependent enzyme [Candidatus Amoebophilus sp.]